MELRITAGQEWDDPMFECTVPVFANLSEVKFKRGSEMSLSCNAILVSDQHESVNLKATIGACRQFETLTDHIDGLQLTKHGRILIAP